LVFGSSYGSGQLDPERIVPPAERSMNVCLTALAELGPAERASKVTDPVLRGELTNWGDRSEESRLDPRVLLMGLLSWTRAHGIISLEIEGFFEQVGVDPARLFETEINCLVAQRTGR
jgi:Tetracyclin repressor-like, C-terminal domain